jgi:hypothetical protein
MLVAVRKCAMRRLGWPWLETSSNVPLIALDQVQPMDDVISNVEAPRRFNTSLLTIFAIGALVLVLALTGA